jgi:Outer membrane receptor proteins, mostly Fe transport
MSRLVALSCVWLFASSLSGQSLTGSVSGIVLDTSGSPIASAKVVLQSNATAATRQAVTNHEGDFSLNAIQSGVYTLVVEHPGFKKYSNRHIELAANENISLGEIKLEVGSLSDSITVSGDVTTLQLAGGERSGVITSQEIENLTVMNRDFATLVALLPGVVDNPGTSEVQGFSGGASFNVSGNRSNSNSITIDGASVENTNGGNGNMFVSMDSIQTVAIVTSNYQAEFGRKPGAGIRAISKGGSQKYHGAAYWYYRHESLNANDFFSNRQGLPVAIRRIQTPGGNIGGPLYIPGKFNRDRTKLFFFASLESIRERRPQSIRKLTVPTELERIGDFSQSLSSSGKLPLINDPMNGKLPFPGNIIPPSRINPSGQNYLKLLPLPNGVDAAIARNAYNYQVQESTDIPKLSETTRLDWVVNPKTSVWLKYSYWKEDQQGWAFQPATPTGAGCRAITPMKRTPPSCR